MRKTLLIILSALFMAICIGLYGYFMETLRLHPPFIINYLVGVIIGISGMICYDYLKRIFE